MLRASGRFSGLILMRGTSGRLDADGSHKAFTVPAARGKKGICRYHGRCARECAILEGAAARSETPRIGDRAGARGCRWCTGVLASARRGLAQGPWATLLGAQNRKCLKQIAEEPAAEGQDCVARYLDG